MKQTTMTTVVQTHIMMKRLSLKLSGRCRVLKASSVHETTSIRLYTRKDSRPVLGKSHASSTYASRGDVCVFLGHGVCSAIMVMQLTT